MDINAYSLNPMIFNDPTNAIDQFTYAEPRIGEYPADAYYTATGTGPANSPALGWI
jgi:hypothetical protein